MAQSNWFIEKNKQKNEQGSSGRAASKGDEYVIIS